MEKSNNAKREEETLKFWKENDIFQKSLEKNKDGEKFVFFEGPPTANAKPALHHLEARAFKDVIPRYKTMQGFNVPRRAGWDTHGLPVELQIEKKLGLTSKKEIETYGVDKFNKECKDSVFEYIGEWEKFTDRIGYWVDKENAYYTFDTNYIESLWNIVGKVNDQGLLYKDYKVVPWCPRCGTGLSSHELAQGYQYVKDLSVYAKFKIVEQDNTYLLAWTTTPWTLPGNVGLAVGKDIEYVKIKLENEYLILGKERLILVEKEYKIVEEMKGECLVGLEYEPLYPYLKSIITGSEAEKISNAYKVYSADFVNTTDGTGIVHTAVMYGQDDFELGTKVGLPKFHLVDETGYFVEGTDFLEKRFVKDENVAIDIIKDLAHRGLLFKKEKYEHSYPHCWRCKTPLIYYARDSWYIAMSKLRDNMIAENKNINWEPAHIREGRFGEWIDGIRDWAISRERYWGTPLPIWESADGERIFVDSFETLKKYTKKSGNKYFVMRHGEADNNTRHIVSYGIDADIHLTDKGKEQIIETAHDIADKKFDYVFVSPVLRTQETFDVLKSKLDFSNSEIITEESIQEINTGEFGGKSISEYKNNFTSQIERFTKRPKDGECINDVKLRVGKFMYELESKYQNKNILIISHGDAIWMMHAVVNGMTNEQSIQFADESYPKNAEFKELDFVSLPHNANYELDPHRPYIDNVVLEKDGKEFHRVKEVMDVWFDSGSMPFAQDHYPFENKDTLSYPADFISEAIDQTRGWFYTLHAVGNLMGKGKAYKNVICLGHLLDAEGKKMSKSIGNIVDPWLMMDRYGVDALRLWMYSVNQPGDSKNFDEKTVKEIEGKILTLFNNVLSFYELYRNKSLESNDTPQSENILDQWILSRFNEFVKNATNYLDNYKLLEPVREIREFIGDLSTWYLRRSRERLKDGDVDAKKTLYYVLKTFSKILAPFAPFAAEDIWQKLKLENDAESVHLAEWPASANAAAGKPQVLAEMQNLRDVVSIGLKERQKSGMPVRQPLATLKVKSLNLQGEYLEILKDELNVKSVAMDNSIEGEVWIDMNITPELKKEGEYRELLRAVQDMRKKEGLMPSDTITLSVSTDSIGQALVKEFENDFKKIVGAKEIKIGEVDGTEIKIGDLLFKVKIEKPTKES